MKHFFKQSIAASLILIASVSACDDYSEPAPVKPTPQEETPAKKANATAFHAELSKRYLAFAEAEKARYDWSDASHFVEKAAKVAAGNNVPADLIESRDIADYAFAELTDARKSMQLMLDGGLRTRDPKRAAKLQYYFDCWLEEQEEAWEIPAIEQCQKGFYRQMKETDPPVIAQGGPLSTSYLLHFDWDNIQLAKSSLDDMRDMAARIAKERSRYHVTINGHADRSGSDDYNLQLSQQRAEFVKELLINAGLSPKQVSYFAFGESDPAEETPDGMRNRANRRVEIYIE